MRAALITTAAAIAACCGAERPPMPPSRTPVEAHAELPAELAAATLHGRGALEPLFASASADGATVAVMLDSEAPGVVAVLRRAGDRYEVERALKMRVRHPEG